MLLFLKLQHVIWPACYTKKCRHSKNRYIDRSVYFHARFAIKLTRPSTVGMRMTLCIFLILMHPQVQIYNFLELCYVQNLKLYVKVISYNMWFYEFDRVKRRFRIIVSRFFL